MEPWNSESLKRRLTEKIDRRGDEECWPWLGCTVKGRGRIYWGGGNQVSPRMVKIVADERWPDEGLCACHRCDNAACCNPAHIYWGTPAQNAQDASNSGLLRGPAPHSHCAKGHLLDKANRLSGRNRGCRQCTRERFTRWQRARRAENRREVAAPPV